VTRQTLYRLCDQFFGEGSDPSLREDLRLSPETSVRAAVRDLGLEVDDSEAELVAFLLVESITLATESGVAERERSAARIDASVRSLRRAHVASLVTNGVLAFCGVALVVLAAVHALRGDVAAAVLAGGLGTADIALLLWKSSVQQINASAVDLTQLRIVYATYVAEIDQLALRYEFLAGAAHMPVKRTIADALHQQTAATLDDIERYVEGVA
jgi:hypothetical protein